MNTQHPNQRQHEALTHEMVGKWWAQDRLAARPWRGAIGAMQAISEAARLATLAPKDWGNEVAELNCLFDLPAHVINADAARAAEVVGRMCDGWDKVGASPSHILSGLQDFAQRHHVELPKVGTQSQPVAEKAHKVRNRLCSPLWWRRALRKRFRIAEEAAIAAGTVRRGASPYASAAALARAADDRRRLDAMVDCMEVANTVTGEVLALADVVAASLANPANRRAALAVRIKGVEQHAKAQGMDGLFLTLTCPSRMHATSGKYAGTTPRQAHAYLCRVWANAMRKAKHMGVRTMGLRVVEPHHDACPHWHILAFVRPAEVDTFTQTVHAYALADTPDEAGAAEHRFTVARIDPAKGSALAYVMKYVSKSIDGEGVGEDTETDQPGKDAARAIVTWARTHGIRQFQFFGLPAVTPQRELHRLAPQDLPTAGHDLQEVHGAIKENEQGAVLALLAMSGLHLECAYTERPSTRYPGEETRGVVGVWACGGDLAEPLTLTTRNPGEWVIQLRHKEESAGLCTPWTRFNNSAFAEAQAAPAQAPEQVQSGAGVETTPAAPSRQATQSEV